MESTDFRLGTPVPFLRAWRQRRMLTQAELARRARVSRSTVIAGEQGRRIQVTKAARLARALRAPSRESLLQSPEEAPSE